MISKGSESRESRLPVPSRNSGAKNLSFCWIPVPTSQRLKNYQQKTLSLHTLFLHVQMMQFAFFFLFEQVQFKKKTCVSHLSCLGWQGPTANATILTKAQQGPSVNNSQPKQRLTVEGCCGLAQKWHLDI